jgi:hypothetical protein
MEAPASAPAPQPPDKTVKPVCYPVYQVGQLRKLRPLQLHLEPLEPRYQMAGFDTTPQKR